MKGHNRWLDWKLKHGLASRGRVGGWMHPKGVFSGLLYKFYFEKRDTGPKPDDQAVYTQEVGGTLGAVGKTNGE